MKRLKNILENIDYINALGSLDINISSIKLDSRKVEKDDAFVAIEGELSDGHDFINQAINKGAIAIICQKIPNNLNEKITYIFVNDTNSALSQIASNYFENPSKNLKIIGITGTNGKTTIATLLYTLFNNLGYKSGLVSTIAYYIGNKKIKSTHTTPDAIMLNSLFSDMIKDNCEYCFMEVSSHSISQKRIGGIEFKGAVFTNLTHDHLDYHKTFKNYLDTKKSFFDNLEKSAFSIINNDDKNGKIMQQNTVSKKYSYSIKSDADYKGKIIESHFDSTLISINNIELWTRFTGDFNASNLTAVYSTASLCGLNKEEILKGISELKPVAGRFETIQINGITGIVDYAHTPDALKNVLETIIKIKTEKQTLITVVGAGGNRDKTKRPIMAKVAVNYSDKLILTSDNPRTEPPTSILDDMERGIEQSDRKKVIRITDRKEAIKTACLFAKKGDIILIAGKGHEDYQEIMGERFYFDDKIVFEEQMEIINN
ncbi:MAG: UDP-N-acetylmuramoyl-L-alanyl-D-glutamate--2,6-diaminopimelate ligase [Bacteroidales bacterium]|nr:UDP-N-acetylmuramoyl-L-alanyl-D-glutamate--2,6-diaminopimelate ligase [Bacteroidales bacterium]